jgi:segregation and condensation protein B
MQQQELKMIIEGALLASEQPLSLTRLKKLFSDYDCPKTELFKAALADLQQEYQQRGVQLVEVASGYRFQVNQQVAPWIARLWQEKPPRYSRALLETLALIVYRQPITRAEIEEVRGVAVSTTIIKTLLERDWIRVVGHREVPGRPALYASTRQFLDYFNLASLDQLPELMPVDNPDTASESQSVTAEDKVEEPREQVPLALIPEEPEPNAEVLADKLEEAIVSKDEIIAAEVDNQAPVEEDDSLLSIYQRWRHQQTDSNEKSEKQQNEKKEN